MNYDLDKFKKDFIDITVNFDEILIQQNNELLNSNEHYLQYKNEYIVNTDINYNKFKNLLDIYNKSKTNYTRDNNNNYKYTYVNKTTLNSVSEELKTILLEQRVLYKVFIDYINFLSKH